MKLVALMMMAIFFPAGAANAESIFGRNTWDLEEKFERPSAEREFYKGEQFFLSKPQRLGGLSELEKNMIETMMKENGDQSAQPELLTEFSMTDGYLLYFSHAPSKRQFVQIAHFPGDNEYGAVFEIEVTEQGTNVLGKVALVQDGDFVVPAQL